MIKVYIKHHIIFVSKLEVKTLILWINRSVGKMYGLPSYALQVDGTVISKSELHVN